MIPVTSLAGRRVALFGLGSSGCATAAALEAGGAQVWAWDDKPETVASAAVAGVNTIDLQTADWHQIQCLVLAPGVPLTHPKPHWTVQRARTAAIEVIGDVELFCRERRQHAPKAPFVAITGTNGKSTTTALIAHLLTNTGLDVQLGGNIGTAVLSLESPASDRYYVVECSSFQIDLAPSLNPSVGVLLNVTADHLDRHGTMEAYAAIKRRLVANADLAVIAVDDDWCRSTADELEQNGSAVVRVSARQPLADGVYVESGELFLAENGASLPIASLDGIASLRGTHNAQNAAAAAAVGHALGLDNGLLAEGLRTFPGLAHRMEEVGRRGRVLFVNDSKATNCDAAAKALASFDRIYWIAGGRAKEGGISELADYFKHIAKAYLIGEAATDFAESLGGMVPHQIVRTLDAAVTNAAADADRDRGLEPVVLLSPACASYDQFANFEQRGDAFRDLVAALDGICPRGEAA